MIEFPFLSVLVDFENNIEVIMSSYWCFTFVA
jgi:hypothetical protein